MMALERLCAAPGAPVYEIGSRCLPWEHQAALVLEFARSRDLDVQALLTAAELQPTALLSPQQLLRLLAELQHRLPAADTPFVLGQLSLPGQSGLPSHALLQAASLAQALHLLVDYAGRLSPLLTPRLLMHGDELILLWTESCGVGAAQRSFIVDMQMSALSAMCQWLGGERLPWRYSFNRTRPRDLSQHAVFLGHELQFDCQVDAMRLPAACLNRAWPRGSSASLAAQALAQGADPAARARGLRPAAAALPRAAQPGGRRADVWHQQRHAQAPPGAARHPLPGPNRSGAHPCGDLSIAAARPQPRGGGHRAGLSRPQQLPTLLQALDRPGTQSAGLKRAPERQGHSSKADSTLVVRNDSHL